jgi:hypothetical protein
MAITPLDPIIPNHLLAFTVLCHCERSLRSNLTSDCKTKTATGTPMAGAGDKKNKTATGLECTRGREFLTRSPTVQQAHSDKESGTPLPKTAFPLRAMAVISICIKRRSCEWTNFASLPRVHYMCQGN